MHFEPDLDAEGLLRFDLREGLLTCAENPGGQDRQLGSWAARSTALLEPHALLTEHQLLIRPQPFQGRALRDDGTPVEHNPALRNELQHIEAMSDEYHRRASFPKFFEAGKALVLKLQIPDRKCFVDEQDVALYLSGHPEAQPRHHPARIGADRAVKPVPQLDKLLDR